MLINENNINKDLIVYQEKLHNYNNQYDNILNEQQQYRAYLDDENITQEKYDYYLDLYDNNFVIMNNLEKKIEILTEAIKQLKNIIEILDIVEVEIEGV